LGAGGVLGFASENELFFLLHGEAMPFIAWTKGLETGVLPVDDQHRHLVELINSLEEAVRSAVTETPLQKIFSDLMLYVKDHFCAEEQIMAAASYPGLARHKLFHEYFVRRLSGFVERYNGEDSFVADELLSFLKLWFVEHVSQTDQDYVPYVLRTQL
jgi:hemerythrin-like metal-binding protein